MSEAVYVIRIIAMGDPEAGLWCDRCLLPSGYRLTFVMESERGGWLGGLNTATGCFDCEDQT